MVDIITVATVLLISVGTFLMGFVVGWIGFYFIGREPTFSASEFAGFITAFFGGAVVTVFTTFQVSGLGFLFWVYPIGLFMAMYLYHYYENKGNTTEPLMRIKLPKLPKT